MTPKNEKKPNYIYDRQQLMTNNKLWASDLGQAHIECDGYINMFVKEQLSIKIGVGEIAQHNYKL